MTQTQSKLDNGFACPLEPDTDLGSAILIAEDEEGNYEPVAVVFTINEAKELAEDDLRQRMRRLESDDDPGLCPTAYKVWARGIGGKLRIAATIES